MRRAFLGVAVLVVLLAGIGVGGWRWLRHSLPHRPNYTFGTGLHQMSRMSGSEKIAENIALGDANGRALVVWSNHDGFARSEMHWEHGVLILSGQVPAADGPVPFRCEVPDSRTGTLALDGNTYDLARGTVFLISADARPPRVTQLDAGVTRLQPGATNESVVSELKKDPRIQAFLNAHGSAIRPANPATRPAE
jgi:hypothetical protein